MPFRSEKQRRYLHIHEPAIANRWEREYGSTPRGKVVKALTRRKHRGRS